MEARFVSGNYDATKHTPGSAVEAGDVIVAGACCLIAHHDIAANEEGAVAMGGGIYEVAANSGDVIAQGDRVYWDDSANTAEEGATSNTHLGYAARAKASGETTVFVRHTIES